MKTMISLGLKYEHKKLLVLDQTFLPHKESWIECHKPDDMVLLIQRLAIRGAPLIGVGAALSLAQFAEQDALPTKIVAAAQKLRNARPTASNLMTCVDRIIQNNQTPAQVVKQAELIFDEEIIYSQEMAQRGATFINDGDNILTHCNTGGLATVGIGTALGAIRLAHERGKRIHVYVNETRPLLQGARLTTWELQKLSIPHTLICDNMAGFLMSQNKVQKIFVGADRIARNGDFANKIGTYSLAVLAHYHGVPFYVVAPETTFDPQCETGQQIPIEQRKPDEVRFGQSFPDCQTWNPAFDVTPRSLVTGIILNNQMI